MKKLILLILAMGLLSCAHQQKPEPVTPEPQGRQIEVPAWFLDFPAGDYCLGIAKLTLFDAEISARLNATVNYSRNNNCYVVNKKAIRESERTAGSGKAEFKVVVSGDTEQLRAIHEKLQLLDSFWFYDNFIGIYSMQKSAIDSTRQSVWFCEEAGRFLPEWYNDRLISSSDMVTTDVQASSHDLVSAFSEAFEAARISLAGYRNIKVDGKAWHINGLRDRLVSLETLVKLNRMNINKIAVRRYLGSGGPGYQVYLRMGMEPLP
jgi:hypothetical protein